MGGATSTLGLVFDLDGTLVESAAAISAVGDRLMSELNLAPLPVEEGVTYIGSGAPKFLERALTARDALDPARFPQHLERFQDLYAQAPAHENKPFPGVEDALRAFAEEDRPMALCTNKPGAPTRKLLDAFGWSEFFAAIVAGDTLPQRKPDPRPLLAAVDALVRGRGASKCLFIGDSDVDSATARAASVPFALFTEGYRRSTVEELAPDEMFSDFRRLQELVAKVEA